MGRLFRRLRLAACAVAGLAAAGAALAQAPTRQQAPFFAIIDQINIHEGLTRATVDDILGDTLYPYSTDYYAQRYRSGKIDLNNAVSYSADYRGATRANVAIRNSVLTLTLDKGCIGKDVVLAKYPGLAVTETPPVKPLVEQTFYARKEAWGDLLFGFADNDPNCLESAVASFVATDF